MGQFFPDIAWRTILREVALDATDYQYTVKVLPEDPNEPGADPMVVDEDCWIVDYAGYTYQIVNVSGNELTLYDINKRKWGDNFIGPTPNMEAYVYKPKNGAFLLTQAQLRYLDKSATDKIYPVEKGVAWAHRGIRLGEDEIATELEIEGAEVTYEGEGWRGGGKYKITIVSEEVGEIQSEYLAKEVEQEEHGFDADFIYYNGSEWEKAIATDADTCATHFSVKIDLDTFYIIPVGELYIESLKDDEDDGVVAGEYYFLSTTIAGKVCKERPEEGYIQSLLKVNGSGDITISIQEPYVFGKEEASELPEHNELDGLNSGNYQHLTSTEKSNFDTLVGGTDIGSTLHNHNTLYEVPLTISNSLRRTTNTLDLQGDNASPGYSNYYGTSALGDKGFYPLPTIPTIPSFINSVSRTGDNVALVGDAATPGNSKYYGTNSSGTKGFHNLPLLPSLKTIAGNNITGSGNLINIYVSSSEPSTTGKLDGDIWVEE